MEHNLTHRVALRYLQSDTRYQIPAQYKHILQMVDEGELDPQVLLAWKYVVEKMGPKFSYGGAVKYWQNKCAKMGIDLPASPEVRAQYGAFKVKNGDEIEEWVKEYLQSRGLISDVGKTAAEREFEIQHFQRMIDDAKDRIAKHEKGLAEGSRVKQREKWLAQARKDLEKASKDLDKAQEACKDIQETIVKHEKVEAPVIDFEKQFQLLLHQAANDLSKREVLAKAKAALEKFEDEMTNPRLASEKQAFDLWDKIKGLWQRLWDRVLNAFDAVADWADDLLVDRKQLQKLLDSVS